MAKMLRNTPNRNSKYTDTCSCRQCRRRGAVDVMVRRQQRAREKDVVARIVAEETA